MTRESIRKGQYVRLRPFTWYVLQEAAAAATFNTDQVKTDTPTLNLAETELRGVNTIQKGIINRIHYRINPANAVTYTLRLWDDAIANDYESNLHMLYETAAAQVDDTDYDNAELCIPFVLGIPDALYYSLDWTGPSGNVQGFLEVSGVCYE